MKINYKGVNIDVNVDLIQDLKLYGIDPYKYLDDYMIYNKKFKIFQRKQKLRRVLRYD
jgi:hypothetical protein